MPATVLRLIWGCLVFISRSWSLCCRDH